MSLRLNAITLGLLVLGLGWPCTGKTQGHVTAPCLSEALEGLIHLEHSCPEQFRQAIDNTYQATRHSMSSVKQGPSTAGAALAERLPKGENHSHFLTVLGATVENGALSLPADVNVLFDQYREYVQKEVASGKLNNSEIIYPALVFQRKGGSQGDYLVVAPGVDPWPDPKDYEFVPNPHQFSQLFWERSMGAGDYGRMPISLGNFLDHDLGHLTEFMDQPALMREVRAYYRWAAGQSDAWRDQIGRAASNVRRSGSPAEKHFDRLFTVAEFFGVPDVRQSPLIRELIPQYFRESGPRDVESNIRYLKSLSPSDLQRHCAGVLAQSQKIILRQGGGSRDSYNLVLLGGEENMQEIIENAVVGGVVLGPSDATFGGGHSSAQRAEDTLTVLARKIELAFRLRYESERSSLRKIEQELRRFNLVHGTKTDLTAEQLNSRLDTLLIDELAHFETALYQAVKLGITPAQIMKDSSQVYMSALSPTYLYLKAFVKPGTSTWKYFLDPANLDPNLAVQHK